METCHHPPGQRGGLERLAGGRRKLSPKCKEGSGLVLPGRRGKHRITCYPDAEPSPLTSSSRQLPKVIKTGSFHSLTSHSEPTPTWLCLHHPTGTGDLLSVNSPGHLSALILISQVGALAVLLETLFRWPPGQCSDPIWTPLVLLAPIVLLYPPLKSDFSVPGCLPCLHFPLFHYPSYKCSRLLPALN